MALNQLMIKWDSLIKTINMHSVFVKAMFRKL